MSNDNGLELFSKKLFRIEIMCFLSAGIHLVYLIIFLIFHIGTLMCFNIFSVLFYIGLGIFAFSEKAKANMKYMITAVHLEIVVYSLICTLSLGFDSCFFLLALVSLHIGIYYLFVHCSANVFKRVTPVFLSDVILCTVIEAVFTKKGSALSEKLTEAGITGSEIKFLCFLNIFFTIFLLFICTMLFCGEIAGLLEQLRYTANHDALTGLSNRTDLWNYFGTLEHSGKKFSVTMGDLDDFKKINDTYGHDCGDLVLKSVAKIIAESVNENEMACRWGGEEMLIIMTGSSDECFERVNEIKEKINELKIVYDNTPVLVTMTFGFACSFEKEKAEANYSELESDFKDNSKKHSILADSLISMADSRLYTGKRSGKNVVIKD